MSDEDKERYVIEHEGEEHLFEELFRFTAEDTGISYIVLVPAEDTEETEDSDEVEVFAFRFEEGEGNDISFYPIESDEEWDMVEEMLNTFSEPDE